MQNIVITGTSQGIGLELVKIALEKGHKVLAIARPSTHLHELKSLVDQHLANLHILEVDLTESDALDKISAATDSWGKIDILINNAGIYRPDETLNDFLESFETNTVIPFFLTKTLFPRLHNSSSPKAIFLSSLMGSIEDNHSGGSHSYRASKTALNMIVKGLSQEDKKISFLLLHPGWVQTNMGGERAPLTPADSAKGLWKQIQELKEGALQYLDYQGKELPW
jgi:short-subunit dehydrogenase